MRTVRNTFFVVIMLLLPALPGASQMGMRPPDFRGVFNPVVGTGAAYEMDGKAGKNQMEITIVGKEDVDGKPGFWMEMAITDAKAAGQMYLKNLMVIDGKNSTVSRTVIQPPGQAPMEISGMGAMMNRGGQTQNPASTDIRTEAEHVGTEDVTTPAGTFSCEHYRAKDGSWDAWISPKVNPWGLVKSTGNDTTMTLVRVITDAKDHITGTPQKFDPAQMMRQRMGQQPPQ